MCILGMAVRLYRSKTFNILQTWLRAQSNFPARELHERLKRKWSQCCSQKCHRITPISLVRNYSGTVCYAYSFNVWGLQRCYLERARVSPVTSSGSVHVHSVVHVQKILCELLLLALCSSTAVFEGAAPKAEEFFKQMDERMGSHERKVFPPK